MDMMTLQVKGCMLEVQKTKALQCSKNQSICVYHLCYILQNINNLKNECENTISWIPSQRGIQNVNAP